MHDIVIRGGRIIDGMGNPWFTADVGIKGDSIAAVAAHLDAAGARIIDATGLEKGGIYNHFGSKEQLALEAYDFAMTCVTEHLARSQDDATDAPDRLTRMIRAFSESARPGTP